MKPTLPVGLVLGCLAALAQGAAVRESARDVPVAYRVDVVVVGGSTGAVAAAVAAAQEGASVFLATDRPYLGEDVAGTLRIWLEDGETPAGPLAEALFAPEGRAREAVDRRDLLPFRYTADRPSAGVHKDTKPPRILRDRAWGRPENQSVQYDGPVTLLVDLERPQEVASVSLVGYQRPTQSPFDVAEVTVEASEDGKSWRPVTELKNADLTQPLVTLEAKVGATVRALRLHVRHSPKAERILLGEILVHKPMPDRPKSPRDDRFVVRPLHVKKTLDRSLLDAGVQFLFGCYVTDVLRDGDGRPCGIVMANRAGRQAVVAKTVIDATDRAWVARQAGARFRPYPSGRHTFRRVVIGGEPRSGEHLSARVVGPPLRPDVAARRGAGGPYRIMEYTLSLPMEDGSFASWARAEQLARDLTYHPDQQLASDRLFQVPPDPVHGRKAGEGEWRGVAALDLDSFRPAGVDRLYVLGGCADVPREQAARLLRPLALMALGRRIGKAAAAEARGVPSLQGVHLAGAPAADAVAGEVRERLAGVRPIQDLSAIPQRERGLAVLGRYDVVVIGGGTGGAPAGIGAARQGTRVLVVEYLHGLGGVGTLGAISKYYWGNRVGFTDTVPGGASWEIERKMEWWRAELRKAGADIWFGSIGCGALVDQGRVVGAVVATPQGRGVVLGKVIVDSTGNADIAAAAGADCMYTDGSMLAMQGTGLPPRRLGASYTNTDFTIADETDMLDVWHLLVYAKDKYGDAFDAGQLVDTRERRRIVGDVIISPLDQINDRTFPDTIAISYSNFDSHGYTVHPFFSLRWPHKKGIRCHMPYRAFLPKGLDGILVTGLGVSAHRDAIPVIRMQPDIQNHGYAVGLAAAMLAKSGGPTRSLDVKALQQQLVEIGNLPESVLDDEDSYPLPKERVAEAVRTLPKDYQGAAIVLAQPEDSLPLLRQAYAKVNGEAKRAYAHVLAILGDPAGVPTLIEAVNAFEKLDRGWNYRGMGQFGASLSRLDSYLMALGRAGDRRATPAIVAKLRLLRPEADFSHFRAAALALGRLRDPRAAAPLAEVLRQEGIRGKAIPSVEVARQRDAASPGGTNAVKTRRESLRELFLAAALTRCGDHEGLGEAVLKEYTQDLRGHLARYAAAVLEQGGK